MTKCRAIPSSSLCMQFILFFKSEFEVPLRPDLTEERKTWKTQVKKQLEKRSIKISILEIVLKNLIT